MNLSLRLFTAFLLQASLSCSSVADPAGDGSPPLSFLALGDSYTIGQSVAYNERWPMILADRLKTATGREVTVQFIAQTGWTTGNLESAINASTLSPPYSLVSLLIGVNNQYQGQPFSAYTNGFPALLARALTLAGGDTNRVLVVSIPDYAYTPFGQTRNPAQISSALDMYNATNRMYAGRAGVRYFDITPISREGLIDPALVAGDGLHPSGKQYARWVDLMESAVVAMLSN